MPFSQNNWNNVGGDGKNWGGQAFNEITTKAIIVSPGTSFMAEEVRAKV